MDYCAPADMYAFGLPRGALANPGRLAGTVSLADNTIELDGHGAALNDPVSFRAEAGGSLPTPLQDGRTYFVILIDDGHFSVALAADGSAIDLTSAGAGIVVIFPLPITSAITWASRIIDDMLPAALVPLTAPIAPIVRMTAAELAAFKLLGNTGGESKSLGDMADAARKRVARWALGIPIRGDGAPEPANNAQTASLPSSDTRGWARYGGIG